MKVRVNLATRPYEDATRFYTRWLGGIMFMLVLAILLSWLSWRRYQEFGSLRANLEATLLKNAQLQKDKDEQIRVFNLEKNTGTREQSEILNGVFLRKSFSWTQTMQDMESIVPENVQVISLQPKLVKVSNGDQPGIPQLQISIIITGARREDVITMLQRLEESPHFLDAELTSESGHETDKHAMTQFEISATYAPDKLNSKPDHAQRTSGGTP